MVTDRQKKELKEQLQSTLQAEFDGDIKKYTRAIFNDFRPSGALKLARMYNYFKQRGEKSSQKEIAEAFQETLFSASVPDNKKSAKQFAKIVSVFVCKSDRYWDKDLDSYFNTKVSSKYKKYYTKWVGNSDITQAPSCFFNKSAIQAGNTDYAKEYFDAFLNRDDLAAQSFNVEDYFEQAVQYNRPNIYRIIAKAYFDYMNEVYSDSKYHDVDYFALFDIIKKADSDCLSAFEDAYPENYKKSVGQKTYNGYSSYQYSVILAARTTRPDFVRRLVNHFNISDPSIVQEVKQTLGARNALDNSMKTFLAAQSV